MAVERVGISFEPELLEEFDELISKKGYTNRSEAVRDLVRKALIEAGTEEGSGEAIGTITVVYDHDVRGLTERLLHLEHHHHSEISSTTHIHIDEHACLEVLIVKGHVDEIRMLSDNIKALKGIKHGELVLTKVMPHGRNVGHAHH